MCEGQDRTLDENVYYLKKSNQQSLIYTTIEGIMEPTRTLIDSGSSRNFIDSSYAKAQNIPTETLKVNRSVIAIDGKTIKDAIKSKSMITVTVEGRTFRCKCYVMELGDTKLILGQDWLEEADPNIRWKDMTIAYRDQIQGKAVQESEVLTGVPKEFWEFEDLFREEGFSTLPEHRPYDCMITLIEGAELPKPAKTYPMSPAESTALKEYLDKELKDGKI